MASPGRMGTQTDLYSWEIPTLVRIPSDSGSFLETPSSGNGANSPRSSSNHSEEESWAITKRDVRLPSDAAVRVMDHAHVVLSKRLSEAHEGLDLFQFQTNLARFANSEIELGKRVAHGNFADIFLIKQFQDPKMDKTKACSTDQSKAAEKVKMQCLAEDLVVKVLRPSLLKSPSLYATAAADILTEGTLLATLQHPHIVSLWGRSILSAEGFASGKRDSFFLLLERLEGNLMDKINHWNQQIRHTSLVKTGFRESLNNKATILKERLEAMVQLASAIQYLHENKIIHRDLKLSNVGFDRRGQVKLIDFGLAKILPQHQSDKETFQMTGNTGSIRYMAPEIARCEKYNLKADIYSFSILLYEVLNLDKAWKGVPPRNILYKVQVRKQRPTLSVFWPVALRDLIKSTWSDLPSARLSMRHVQVILEKELQSVTTTTTPPPTTMVTPSDDSSTQ